MIKYLKGKTTLCTGGGGGGGGGGKKGRRESYFACLSPAHVETNATLLKPLSNV